MHTDANPSRHADRSRQRSRVAERAVGYLRCSTDRQPVSLDAQRATIERWAKERDIAIVRWHVDDAISGASAAGRDGFQRMVTDIEEYRDVGLVLCYDVSRFGRTDNDEAGFYRYRLHVAGASVYYVAEASLTGSPADDLLLSVLQWQKRDALRALSRDTLRGQVRLALRGSWCGGPAPFGYARQVIAPDGTHVRTLRRGQRSHNENGERVILVLGDVGHVEAVRLAWDLRWVQGASLKAIRSRFAALGVKPVRTETWSTSSIRSILHNGAYTGRMTYGLRTHAKFHRVSPQGAKPRPRSQSGKFDRHSTEPIVVEGAHDPIASEQAIAEFRAWEATSRVRRLTGEPARARAQVASSPWLLTGLVCCAKCGSSYIGSRRTRRKATKTYVYEDYTCNGYHQGGLARCVRYVVKKRILEASALKAVREKWIVGMDPDAVRAELRRHALEQLGPDLLGRERDVERQVDALNDRMEKIVLAINPAHADVVNHVLERLKREREILAARLEEARRRAKAHGTAERVVEEALKLVGNFEREWADGSARERKALLSAFIQKIVIDPEAKCVELLLRNLPWKGAPPAPE